MSISKSNKVFSTGILLATLAGGVPLYFGLYYYVQNWLNYREGAASQFVLFQQHIAMTNLVVTGVTAILLSQFGLKKEKKWAWFGFLIMTLWVGGNDSAAFILFTPPEQFPVPLIPFAFGLLGLSVTYPTIFRMKSNG